MNTPMAHRQATSTIWTIAVLLPYSAIAQLNYGFLKDSPADKFDDTDRTMMKAAIVSVLQDADPHARQEWDNPRTKHSGVVDSLSLFVTRDNKTCKRLRVDNRASAGISNRSDQTFCKAPGGEWVLDGAAKKGT